MNLDGLRAELDALHRENRELRTRVGALEARLDAIDDARARETLAARVALAQLPPTDIPTEKIREQGHGC